MGIRDSMFGACVIHILYVLSVAWSADLVQHHGTSTCKGYHAKLTCPEDNRIAIRAILYGTHREYCDQRAHGMEHCCSSLVDDCIFSHKAAILSMNTYCSGLDSCIGSSHPTGEMPKHHCGFHLSYMKVNYDCVPKKVVAEFCTDSTYTDSSLYISSPAYPASMGAGNSSCSCVVTAGRTADVNISIQAIDILFTGVGYRPRICEQKLSIRSKKHPEPGNFSIDCNDQKMYGFREIYNSDGNRWLLTLNTHYASNRGRVWLLVKSVDSDHRLTVRCGPTMRWEEFESVHVPDMSESTRRYIGIGILAGLALAICGAIILVVTIVIWQCSRRRKSKKYDVKDKKKQPSTDYAPSGEKPLQNEDTGCGMCKTLPQHKPPNSKKERKSSKTYATVPRNLESRRYQEHDSMTTFPQSPTTSSQQEFLHDYSIPPPPAGPYENMCMNSATFPRGRPLVPDPYAQYYAAIQPRQPGPYDPLSHAPAVPTYSAGADDEEWPPPYVPEEMDMVENTLYESANYH